jgi:hypothetical protein
VAGYAAFLQVLISEKEVLNIYCRDYWYAKNVAMLITANQSALVQGKVKGALMLTTVV